MIAITEQDHVLLVFPHGLHVVDILQRVSRAFLNVNVFVSHAKREQYIPARARFGDIVTARPAAQEDEIQRRPGTMEERSPLKPQTVGVRHSPIIPQAHAEDQTGPCCRWIRRRLAGDLQYP